MSTRVSATRRTESRSSATATGRGGRRRVARTTVLVILLLPTFLFFFCASSFLRTILTDGRQSCSIWASAQPYRRPENDSSDGAGAGTAAGAEFVQQVLEEEAAHYGDRDDNPYATDEQVRAQEEAEKRERSEQERLRKAEEQRLAHEEADRIRRQREDAFEREVSKMNEQQAKKARQKKRRDAKVVQRILRAAAREDHYAVLGLTNVDIRISARSFGIGRWAVRLPGLRLLHASSKDVKKAYRKLSVLVHPDRNRDGRANEAFIALEKSASILSDDALRNEYDEGIRRGREQRQKQATRAVTQTANALWQTTSRAVAVFRTVLGPFAFPVAVLGSLIV
jgi:DnaJ domain